MQYKEKHFLVLTDFSGRVEEEECDTAEQAYRALDDRYRSRGYKNGHYERHMTVRLATFARAGV